MFKKDYKLVPKSAKWKPIAIESNDGFNDNDFDGLIAIEELDDYEDYRVVDNDSNKRKTNSDNYINDKTEKLRKKRNKKLKSNQKIIKNELKKSDINESNECVIDSKQMHLWDSLSIPECVMKALTELKFFKPTPIQSLAITHAIRDQMDIIGAAETGSGKTLAFGIPLIHFIINDKLMDSSCKRLRALVLTPTRELAIQVKKHIEAIAKYSGVSVGVIVGGMSVQKQERVLNKVRPDIIVATPGRLWELIEDNSSEHLELSAITQIKYLVIDEADRMTEKGHFDELRKLSNLLKRYETQRQVFVFSATLTLTHSPPKRLNLFKPNKKNKKNKINETQKMNTIIEMLSMRSNRTKVIDLTREGIGTPNEQLLTETKMNCLSHEKDLYLYYFISLFPGRTLIFCNSKDCLRRLVNVMKLLQLNPLPLHAAMPQKRRLTNLEKFESNANSLLIASDVAARGLDIANIDHVVHYQIPRTAEIYIHRSGRTARAFNKGLSLMLCEPKEEANYYKQLCKTLNKGNDLQTFPVDQNILKSLKQRIDLAQKCDQLDHKIRKEKSRINWFRNTAKQCDIYTDEDSSDLDDSVDKNSETRKLNIMKKQLNALLKKPFSQTKSLYAHLLKNGSTNWTQLKGNNISIYLQIILNKLQPLSLIRIFYFLLLFLCFKYYSFLDCY